MSTEPLSREPDSSAPPHEVGTWALAYLGPGFRVQLRVARRRRDALLDGFMSPARPVTVLLISAANQQVLAETSVSATGRFEFPGISAGAGRLMFLDPDSDRPLLTPPFWI